MKYRVRIGDEDHTVVLDGEGVHIDGEDVAAHVEQVKREVLVIERRLLLKEEVRVRRVRSTERHQESVTLRHHEAVVTRLPVEPPAVGEDSDASAKPQQSKQE